MHKELIIIVMIATLLMVDLAVSQVNVAPGWRFGEVVALEVPDSDFIEIQTLSQVTDWQLSVGYNELVLEDLIQVNAHVSDEADIQISAYDHDSINTSGYLTEYVNSTETYGSQQLTNGLNISVCDYKNKKIKITGSKVDLSQGGGLIASGEYLNNCSFNLTGRFGQFVTWSDDPHVERYQMVVTIAGMINDL